MAIPTNSSSSLRSSTAPSHDRVCRRGVVARGPDVTPASTVAFGLLAWALVLLGQET
ncbi:MAG TPA: hypothetical protein VGC06_04585 [Actinomycetes bacterium]